VVETFSGETYCLEKLALSKCYRVADVCAALGCSERYLYSAFLRDIGLPPKTWMNLERMVVARRMLEGGKPIEKVAADLGFMSLEAFGRRFYKVYKMSPGRFVRSRRIFDPSSPPLLPPTPSRPLRKKPRQSNPNPAEEE
jgi:AraC-like DNA-binding protein